MNFREFQTWAREQHGVKIDSHGSGQTVERVIRPTHHPGTGKRAWYGSIARRRLAVWARWRRLNDRPRGVSSMPFSLDDLLRESQGYADGWLVISGREMEWMEDPTADIGRLLGAGFSAVRCGE